MIKNTAFELNLASKPFGRERAENALLAGICVVLTCSLLVLVSLFLHTRSRAADLRRQIDAENRTLHRLDMQQQKYSTILRRPENADVFSQSVFLNELIARRGVSWTRVFEDLGTVLPGDMRLLAIRLPQVPQEDASGTNRVQLDMIVGSEKPQAVIALLKKLQESSLFGAAAVMTQTPPTQNDPLYKYRVTVPYAQKL
jgi:type IV pilus assembly protein PilN